MKPSGPSVIHEIPSIVAVISISLTRNKRIKFASHWKTLSKHTIKNEIISTSHCLND